MGGQCGVVAEEAEGVFYDAQSFDGSVCVCVDGSVDAGVCVGHIVDMLF